MISMVPSGQTESGPWPHAYPHELDTRQGTRVNRTGLTDTNEQTQIRTHKNRRVMKTRVAWLYARTFSFSSGLRHRLMVLLVKYVLVNPQRGLSLPSRSRRERPVVTADPVLPLGLVSSDLADTNSLERTKVFRLAF